MVLFIILALLLIVLAAYGMHRFWMVAQVWSHRGEPSVSEVPADEDLPRVTVQLPMFNEGAVAQRIIDAACRMEYPRDRLQIQVLDDSTDDSAAIARQCCEAHASSGIDIECLHRDARTGYKAGALAAAMPRATGEFIAIFDADFIPPPDFLRRTIGDFADADVGVVQARWTHLNRNRSWLTRVQALFLDAHFMIEQRSRAASGRWFNFNGTAGLWRRRCIEDAGGWHHDTLTEDTDISYRAQARGWRFRFREDVGCPAELPPSMEAVLSQQHRWNKGLTQTGIKLLPSILESREIPIDRKAEVWFHLTAPFLYPLLLMMTLLVPIAAQWLPQEPSVAGLIARLVGFAGLGLGTLGAATFLVAGQVAQRRPLLPLYRDVPLALALGVGLSVINTWAILEALVRRSTPFVRTPKFGEQGASTVDPHAAPRSARVPRPPRGLLEGILALVMLRCLILNFGMRETLIGAPFLALFAVGYGLVAVGVLRDSLLQRRLGRDRGEIRVIQAVSTDPSCSSDR